MAFTGGEVENRNLPKSKSHDVAGFTVGPTGTSTGRSQLGASGS